MAESVMETISTELRLRSAEFFPWHGDLRALRVVGHTPKPDHTIYDLVAVFSSGSERIATKVYRGTRQLAHGARQVAERETMNMQSLWSMANLHGMTGIPRPIGNFSALGAVVAEKVSGVPLQSIIMKAVLLPGYAGLGTLQEAATRCGRWLRDFQTLTVQPATLMNTVALQEELERLCRTCISAGLDEAASQKILDGTRAVLERSRLPLANCAVLREFTPLSILVTEEGLACTSFAALEESGGWHADPAGFLASVEALGKYPFCNPAITALVQEYFLDAYGASESERELLGVMKMKVLLTMFAAGRTGRVSAARKKVMWANVMKRFIHAAADRSMPHAA